MSRPFTLGLILLLALVFTGALLLGGPQSAVDAAVLRGLQQGSLVPTARILTRFGEWWAFFLIAAVGAALLLFRGRWRKALLLAGLVLSERLLVEALKLFFDRARPDPHGHLVAVHTMAFPSGHATNAMTLGLGLSLLVPVERRNRAAAVAAALVFALLVGLSRPVLGVHWPSDVIGGWSLGALWTLLLVRLLAETSPDLPRFNSK